jgi:site-specific recombinase XerD
VAAYIEQMPGSKPTIKQKLAAIRMLYDFLVIRQLVPLNPTASVRGPKYVVKRGKTPVRSREDTKKLLESIPRDDLAGLRDRALISTMLFSFARVSAVLSLKRQDFYYQGPMRCRHTIRSRKLSTSTCPKSASTTINRSFRV